MATKHKLTWHNKSHQWKKKRRDANGKDRVYYLGRGQNKGDHKSYLQALARWELKLAELKASEIPVGDYLSALGRIADAHKSHTQTTLILADLYRRKAEAEKALQQNILNSQKMFSQTPPDELKPEHIEPYLELLETHLINENTETDKPNSIADAVNQFITIKKDEVTQKRLSNIETNLKSFISFAKQVGVKEINNINAEICLAYRMHLAAKNKMNSTSDSYLNIFKMFVRWLYENELLENLPRNLNALKISHTNKEVLVWSVDEIHQLWEAADLLGKAYISLSLNCGFNPVDIMSLTKNEIIDNRITKARSKTGQSGSWLLWYVTQQLLQSASNGKHKVFVGNVEQVTNSFRRICRAADINENSKPIQERRTFSHFRKTAASKISELSDISTAQQFLAHSKRSIAENHYLQDNYSRLDAATDRLEELLNLEI